MDTCGFSVHTGKSLDEILQGHRQLNPDPDYSKTTKTVVGLLNKLDLLDCKRHVYFDNWYIGPELLEELAYRLTWACGTIRKNRKNLPEVVVNAKLKLEKNSFRRKGPVLAVKWWDKRAVTVISTIH